MSANSATREWIVGAFAVCGAFFIAGLGGSIASDMLGFWHLPGSGFSAALAVVLCTYFAAPSHKFTCACLALAAGAAVAWRLLEPSWYPENYNDLGYQPTHLPVLATYIGGAIGLLVAGLLAYRAKLSRPKA
jgi:hypothetical protein